MNYGPHTADVNENAYGRKGATFSENGVPEGRWRKIAVCMVCRRTARGLKLSEGSLGKCRCHSLATLRDGTIFQPPRHVLDHPISSKLPAPSSVLMGQV